MNIQIKSRFTAAVLFEHDAENNSIRLTLDLAIKSGANLRGANLRGANLRGANLHDADLSGANLRDANLHGANLHDADLSGANLRDANLHGANLSGANLHGANLRGADLRGADLRGANLSGANLHGANLRGANLRGTNLHGANLKNKEKLVGRRPIFQIGPIGSRCAYFVAYVTDKGLRLDAGGQHQITREVFEDRLNELHGENDHAKEYRAALALIDAHAEIWAPKVEAAPAVEAEVPVMES